MERSRTSPSLIVMFGVLGLLAAIAFNTNLRVQYAGPKRASGLSDVVRDLERQRGDLQDRLAGLRDRVTDLEHRAASASGMRDSFGRELEKARVAAGLTAVRGEGVEVVVGDAEQVPPGEDPGAYLVHDFDLRAIVNALLAGGARAVSVNGERVVATTAVRCAGNTILVNSRRLGSPYTVIAVGKPDALLESLHADEQSSLVLERYGPQYGLRTSVKRQRRAVVPEYRGSLRPSFAEPPKGASS